MSLMIKDKELEEDIITAEKFNERRLLLQDLYNKEINNIEFIEFIEDYKMYYLTNCTICKNLKCKQNSNYSLTFFCDYNDCISSQYVSWALLRSSYMFELENLTSEMLDIIAKK